MANIPTIPSVGPIQDPNIGVKVDSGPTQQRFRAASQAIGAAGGAVEEGLMQIADYEHRKQQANEAAFFTKSFITWDKTTASFAKAAKGLDPQDIVPQWSDQVAALKNQTQDDPEYARMTKAAQNKLNDHFEQVTAGATAGFQMESDVRQSAQRWSTALAGVNQSLTTDPENMDRPMAMLKQQRGDAPAGQYEHMVAQLPSMAAIHQIINGSENNAPKTLAAMEAGQFKALNPTQYKEWHAYLKSTTAEYYSSNTQNLYAQADPKTGIIPEDKIRSAMDGGQIQSKTGEALLKTQARQTYKEDDDNRKLLMAGVRNPDDWKTDPTQAQHDFLAEAAGIKNPQVRGEAVAEINRQAAAVARTGQTAERPLERQSLESLKSDPLNIAAREIKSLTAKITGFGDEYIRSDADVKSKYDGMSRDDVVRGFEIQEAEQRDKLHQFFRTHAKDHGGQGPTEMEAETYRQQIVMGPHLDQAAAQVTSASPPHPVGLAVAQDNLASGKAWYEGNPQPVRVRSKDGQIGTIPAANLKKALAAGYTIFQ